MIMSYLWMFLDKYNSLYCDDNAAFIPIRAATNKNSAQDEDLTFLFYMNNS